VIIVDAGWVDETGAPVYRALRGVLARPLPMLVMCSTAKQVQTAHADEVCDVVRQPFDWQTISRRAARIAHSFSSVMELDQLQDALRQALSSAAEARRTLERADGTDALTALPNRKRFRALLTRALSSNERVRLAVMVVGLERFALVNDALGHDEANRVLCLVADRLRECLRERRVATPAERPVTAALSRLGGVRFGLYVVSGDDGELARKRARIADALRAPFDASGQSLHVSATIGAAVAHAHLSDADRLLQNAEDAMLDARRRGGDFRVFEEPHANDAARRLSLERLLRVALARGELRLEYQPLIDIARNRVLGAEALLRWRNAELGDVSPAEFVPIAEESGLMVDIGAFVIERACRPLREWIDAGSGPLRMAVNLSMCQLLRGDVVATVTAALRDSGVPPACLELELSERGAMTREPEILERLQRLKSLGVRLAIDDFGTGDSSIAYLKVLPIDTLKIDRSYVSSPPGELRDAALTAGLIALGRSLDLTVVGEGVESQGQLDMLRDWGCHQCQGFHFAPALPPEAFLARIAASAQLGLPRAGLAGANM
jgi:diguanylate cyclase (GGDEF)-like protein